MRTLIKFSFASHVRVTLTGLLFSLLVACPELFAQRDQCLDPSPRKHKHSLTFSKHIDTPNPTFNIATALQRGSRLLQICDGKVAADQDVATGVTIEQSGATGTFGVHNNGWDIVTTNAELDSVLNNTSAWIKIVTSMVGVCNVPNPTDEALGCGRTPGTTLAIEAGMGDVLAAEVIVHEFGHNKGLPHRDAPGRPIMATSTLGNDQVNQTEAAAYHQGGADDGPNPPDDVAFIIDDTGSMTEEIGGVRDALTAFLGTYPDTACEAFQLATFKDDVSPRAPTTDLPTIRGQVAGLVASGGGDCPEASVEALNLMADSVKSTGTVLFATDASPHPGMDINTTISAYRARGTRVNVLLSGDCYESGAEPEISGVPGSPNTPPTGLPNSQLNPFGIDTRVYKRLNATGDTLILGDNDFIEVNLPFAFPFCGKSYNSVFVNSNGYLTFSWGVYESYPYAWYLTYGPRRIMGYWADLAPQVGGTIIAHQVGPEFQISYNGVMDYYQSDTVNFTIHLRSDGTFRVDYGAMSAGFYGMAGFSAGNGVTDPGEIDLSTASQPIGATGNGTAYELFSSSDNDLSGLSLEYAAKTFVPATGTVMGMKFNDRNGNGVHDVGEEGLQGWTIYASGTISRYMQTDSLGKYRFDDLPRGYYYVGEYSQFSWTQTYPVSGSYSFQVDSGAVDSNKDFGNFHSSGIYGRKFYDANNDGVEQFDEPGLTGWKIHVDGPETSTVMTTYGGAYSVQGLPPGTYVLTEIPSGVAGWTQTYPPGGSWTVVIDTPGSTFNGKDFGNYGAPVTVSGSKFYDQNNNSIKDPGEPFLGGWNITLSGGEYYYTVTDSAGNYTFNNIPPGQYSLAEGYRTGWQQTYPPSYGYDLSLNPGENVTGKEFGNYKLPTSFQAFSSLAIETGGFFAYIPGVNLGDPNEAVRYQNTAYNIVQGGLTKSIGLTDPPEGHQGTTFLMTVTGSKTNFQPGLAKSVAGMAGTTVSISGGGVTVSNVSVISPIQLVAEVTVDPGAAVGFRDVMTVTNLGGTMDTAIGKGSLEISGPLSTPTILGIAPPMAAVGESLSVIVTAGSSNFDNTSVLNLGAGITISNVSALSATKLRADIKVSSSALVGFRNVTVTTGAEIANESVPGPFFVASSAPTIAVISSVSPTSAMQGTSATVQIFGTNTHFADTSVATFSGTGITITATRILSSTLVEVDISLDLHAPLGYRDVFVTTGSEVAAALSIFNVLVNPLDVREGKPLPTQYALRQSFPNPFNPTTTVQFDLPKHSVVTLKIYDVLGREVLALIDNREYEAGTHQVTMDASAFASGVYFYSLKAEAGTKTFTEMKKMVLMR